MIAATVGDAVRAGRCRAARAAIAIARATAGGAAAADGRRAHRRVADTAGAARSSTRCCDRDDMSTAEQRVTMSIERRSWCRLLALSLPARRCSACSPQTLCGQRSVDDRSRHRVRHRRQGRSLVQRRRVERGEVRRDRQVPDGTDCGKPAWASCCATSSRARRSTSSRRCARSPSASYDLIIGIGFAQAPIIEAVAKDYPDMQFAIVDGVSELPNVASLVFKEHEGSYLVGILAAMTTQDRARSDFSAAWTSG